MTNTQKYTTVIWCDRAPFTVDGTTAEVAKAIEAARDEPFIEFNAKNVAPYDGVRVFLNPRAITSVSQYPA